MQNNKIYQRWGFWASLAVAAYSVVLLLAMEQTTQGGASRGQSEASSTPLYPNVCGLESVVCPGEVKARITAYKWTGNRMANGEYPYVGAAAVSDRTWDVKNRKVIALVGNQRYEVKDYTAQWVHDLYGMTLDIFATGTSDELMKVGVRSESVMMFYQD